MSRHRTAISLSLVIVPAAIVAATPSCGSSNEEPYKPAPTWSGRRASLPPVPQLPNRPIKQGDAFTVWGAQHHLRSRVHNTEVNGKELTVVGYIVKTNLPDAPACAVHKTGKGDPEGCKAPIPAFWLADERGDEKSAIKVMGWASNFAQVYDAIEKYHPDGKPKDPKDIKEPVKDEFWGVELPNPIPNVGAKVQLTGQYGVSFTKATSGVESDPVHGTLTFLKMTYVEPPKEPGSLPKAGETKPGEKPAAPPKK